MATFSISWTEAGAEFTGQGLTLAELNRRLDLIRDKRLRQGGTGWYYKTQVLIRTAGFEYVTRLNINERFGRFSPKSFIQDHLKITLQTALKNRNAKNVYGKLYRDHAKGAVRALQLMKKEG